MMERDAEHFDRLPATTRPAEATIAAPRVRRRDRLEPVARGALLTGRIC